MAQFSKPLPQGFGNVDAGGGGRAPVDAGDRQVRRPGCGVGVRHCIPSMGQPRQLSQPAGEDGGGARRF